MEAVIQNISLIITTTTTVILAILTAKYVRLTNSMLEESKAARAATVYVDFEHYDYGLYLIVGNSGPNPAHNLKFSVKDPIKWVEDPFDKGLKGLSLFSNGISYLAPGRTLKYRLGQINYDDKEHREYVAKINVEYFDHINRKNTANFVVDFMFYREVMYDSFNSPLKKISESIEKIELGQRIEKRQIELIHHITTHAPFAAKQYQQRQKNALIVWSI